MPKITERLAHAWRVFRKKDEYYRYTGSSYRPDRVRLTIGNEKSIIASIYNRLSIDVSAVKIRHVMVDVDKEEQYIKQISSGLNNALSLEANIDQTARAFIRDAAISLFDEGCIAIVPVDTTLDPDITKGYDIQTMRVGKILEWYPRDVRVRLYNDIIGREEEVVVSKESTAIIENPLYEVMNEPNSTLKRLISKLNLLDSIDTQSGSGKLDIIIQLPYTIKSALRRTQAEERRAAIEEQLRDSKYGVAYTDGTEKIIQLNRPAENNLMSQIEYLTSMLYSQLGITEKVFDGTADEATMLNYFNRTIEPLVSAITEEMNRKFLSKTGRTQGQRIMAFKDVFKFVPVKEIATIADKFTRNEILSSNEVRAIVGYKPSKDPKADELRNKNLNKNSEEVPSSKNKGAEQKERSLKDGEKNEEKV
jgi:hypothetical protein